VNPRKTAETIEMLFGVSTWVGPKNHVLDGGPDPSPRGRGNMFYAFAVYHITENVSALRFIAFARPCYTK